MPRNPFSFAVLALSAVMFTGSGALNDDAYLAASLIALFACMYLTAYYAYLALLKRMLR